MTVSFFGSSFSTSIPSNTLPVSTFKANDLAVLFDAAVNTTTAIPSTVTNAGWTALGTSQTAVVGGSFGARFNMWYRVFDGTEGASVNTMSGTLAGQSAVVVYRLSVGTWGTPTSITQAVGVTVANQTVTPNTLLGVVTGFGNDFALGGSTALVMTPAGTYLDSGFQRAGYILYDSGAVSNTLSNSISTGGVMGGVWLPYQLGVGALAGAGSLIAVGASAFAAHGTLAGTGSLSGVGKSSFNAPGALAGTGSLAGVGRSAFNAPGSLAGAGSLAGVGQSSFAAPGTLAASGSLAGIGASAFAAPGTLAGAGVLGGCSAAPCSEAVGMMSGSGALLGVGSGGPPPPESGFDYVIFARHRHRR